MSSVFSTEAHNERMESARWARPTRKGEAPLFVARRERWANK